MNLRQKLDRKLAEYRHAVSSVRDEKLALSQSKERLSHALQARKIIQEVAEATQKTTHARIAGVVSRALKTVFGEEAYELQINFVQKRGRTEAELSLKRGELVLDDPLNAVAGGAIDIAALALRLSALVLTQPRRRKILLLDEPMKNVNGKEYQDRAGALVEALAEEMGVCFIIATDDDWLKVGKEIEL